MRPPSVASQPGQATTLFLAGQTYVLIDLETTGANPVVDRITEIAIQRFEGGQPLACFDTLVQPERSIPGNIQRLIGITDAMVADAPRFADLAGQVRALLEGAVFVAHNARFDYGFIRNEFARLGQVFEAPVLCTVKFSRALYPQHHRHGLDALIERHGLQCDARHRATGDVQALRHFLGLMQHDFSAEELAWAVDKAMKHAPRPLQLPDGVLEGLPDSPGVYRLYAEDEVALYVGRSVSLRARVLEHFSARTSRGKQAQLMERVRRVEWEETAGDLSALLSEAHYLQTLRPQFNHINNTAADVFGFRLVPRRKSTLLMQRVPLADTDPQQWDTTHGLFRSRKEADNILREMAAAYMLCTRRLGLEAAGSGGCMAYRKHCCAGVCVGREAPEVHDARLVGALAAVSLKPWPWSAAVVFHERSGHAEREAWHVFDQWCHLGSAASEAQYHAMLTELPPRRFNLDVYRLLSRWLAQPGHLERARAL